MEVTLRRTEKAIFVVPAVLMAWTAPGYAQGQTCSLMPVAGTHTQTPYPPISQRLGENGTAELRVTVGADGAPSQIEIVGSSGSKRLDDAAAAHVKSVWLWQPRVGCGPAQIMVHAGFALVVITTNVVG